MKLKLLGLVAIVILLGGCAGYNLEPSLNEKTKTLKIEDYEISGVNEVSSKNPIHTGRGSFTYKIKNYTSNDTCKKLHYYNMHAGQRSYISSNVEEDMKQYNGNCNVTKIDDLVFHDCVNKMTNNNFYRVSSSSQNQWGFGDIKRLSLTKECFHDMKTHFANKAIKDEIEVTTYTINNQEIPKNAIKYIGTSTEESNDKRCAKEADIVAYIINGEIMGNVFFEYNGKKVDRKAWGKVVNNEFHGETNRLKFYGDFNKNSDEIKGEYFNKVCKGTFELKLDKSSN